MFFLKLCLPLQASSPWTSWSREQGGPARRQQSTAGPLSAQSPHTQVQGHSLPPTAPCRLLSSPNCSLTNVKVVSYHQITWLHRQIIPANVPNLCMQPNSMFSFIKLKYPGLSFALRYSLMECKSWNQDNFVSIHSWNNYLWPYLFHWILFKHNHLRGYSHRLIILYFTKSLKSSWWVDVDVDVKADKGGE